MIESIALGPDADLVSLAPLAWAVSLEGVKSK